MRWDELTGDLFPEAVQKAGGRLPAAFVLCRAAWTSSSFGNGYVHRAGGM